MSDGSPQGSRGLLMPSRPPKKNKRKKPGSHDEERCESPQGQEGDLQASFGRWVPSESDAESTGAPETVVGTSDVTYTLEDTPSLHTSSQEASASSAALFGMPRKPPGTRARASWRGGGSLMLRQHQPEGDRGEEEEEDGSHDQQQQQQQLPQPQKPQRPQKPQKPQRPPQAKAAGSSSQLQDPLHHSNVQLQATSARPSPTSPGSSEQQPSYFAVPAPAPAPASTPPSRYSAFVGDAPWTAGPSASSTAQLAAAAAAATYTSSWSSPAAAALPPATSAAIQGGAAGHASAAISPATAASVHAAAKGGKDLLEGGGDADTAAGAGSVAAVSRSADAPPPLMSFSTDEGSDCNSEFTTEEVVSPNRQLDPPTNIGIHTTRRSFADITFDVNSSFPSAAAGPALVAPAPIVATARPPTSPNPTSNLVVPAAQVPTATAVMGLRQEQVPSQRCESRSRTPSATPPPSPLPEAATTQEHQGQVVNPYCQKDIPFSGLSSPQYNGILNHHSLHNHYHHHQHNHSSSPHPPPPTVAAAAAATFQHEHSKSRLGSTSSILRTKSSVSFAGDAPTCSLAETFEEVLRSLEPQVASVKALESELANCKAELSRLKEAKKDVQIMSPTRSARPKLCLDSEKMHNVDSDGPSTPPPPFAMLRLHSSSQENMDDAEIGHTHSICNRRVSFLPDVRISHTAVDKGKRQTFLMTQDELKEQIRCTQGQSKPRIEDLFKKEGWAARVVIHPAFELVTYFVIVLNAIWMAVDADYNTKDFVDQDAVFRIMDSLFCAYFLAEWGIRFTAFEVKRSALKDSWFIFDSVLVVTTVFETWGLWLMLGLLSSTMGEEFVRNTGALRIVRTLRVMRVARIYRLMIALPELLVLFKGMAFAFRAVISTLGLLLVVVFVFSILFRTLARGTALEEELFPSILRSMAILLITSTAPDLLGLLTEDIGGSSIAFAIVYYLFVMLVTFTVLNLLVGVLVNVVSVVATVERETQQLQMIRQDLTRTVFEVDDDEDQMISKKEFSQMITKERIVNTLAEANIDCVDLMDFREILFPDDETRIPFREMLNFIMSLRGGNTATVRDVVAMRRIVLLEIERLHREMDQARARTGSH